LEYNNISEAGAYITEERKKTRKSGTKKREKKIQPSNGDRKKSRKSGIRHINGWGGKMKRANR